MLRWFYAHFRTLLASVTLSGDSVTCHSWPTIPSTSLILVLGRREYAAVLRCPHMVREVCGALCVCTRVCVCTRACVWYAVWVRVCCVCALCMRGRNELEVYTTLAYEIIPYYISVYTHTHFHIIWGWRTDGAKSQLQNEYKLQEALLKQNLQA